MTTFYETYEQPPEGNKLHMTLFSFIRIVKLELMDKEMEILSIFIYDHRW